ncbi:nucleotidyltransferase family protein [Halobacillus salinarum]|uniref:Nucleotidyltransferase family protein n=1 Tax=Halobacillus salinarum TaxID=2932257 RepID=A0ABY4EGX6_9BACI|nr:nucleotidyltransferase family protein [Halobacillus salinarum]UOQ43702.1 nucleotidyltransferase family protein [Halobacillus salinarum]
MNRDKVGIFLAAGKSKRMGRNKLSLVLERTTIGSHSFSKALFSELDHIYVITQEGDSLNWMEPAFLCEPYRSKWTHVVCPRACDGQAYSLQEGIRRAQFFKATQIVILLADQPFVTPAMINELLKNYREGREEDPPFHFVASAFHGVIQPPLLIDYTLFQDLFTLCGDKGAKCLLNKKLAAQGRKIEYDQWWMFFDIDTEDEYQWITELGPAYQLN